VGEPGLEPLGPEGVGAQDVGDEADPLAGGAEQALEVRRQLGLSGTGNQEMRSVAVLTGRA
jgi:hypothetical protein